MPIEKEKTWQYNSFVLYFVYFLISAFIAFFIPGNLLLRKNRLPFVLNSSLSIVLGIALFSLQSFLFGFFNLRFLTYFYLITCVALWLALNIKKKIPKLNLKLDRIDILILLIFSAGVLLQIFTVAGNAVPIKNGLYFCCGIPDSLYHGALTKELISNFPPNEPGISGVALNNYHFLSNLAIADLIRVFKLPILQTEYQFFPALMSALFGLGAYSLAYLLKIGKKFIALFLVFIFFFGDLLPILTFATTHQFNTNISTIETSMSLWVSMSRYFGITVFFSALSILLIWLKKRTFLNSLALILIASSLIGFKIYIAAIFLSGFSFLSLYFAIKKDFKPLLIFIAIVLISAFIYIPINKGSGGLFFSGFWRFEDFIVQKDLNLSGLELARRVYLNAGNQIKTLFYDSIFFVLYILFSYGTLLVGFFNRKKTLKLIPKEIHVFLISSLAVTLTIGFFFLQKTGGANSSQFLISGYLIGSIYASLFIYSLSQRKEILFKILIIAIIALIIPKTVSQTYNQYQKLSNKNGVIISSEFLSMFKFVNSKIPKNSVLLVDQNLGNTCILLPLLTDAKPYSCDAGAPGDRGINLSNRHIQEADILNNTNIKVNTVKINYILTQSSNNNLNDKKVVYKNSEVKILKYEKTIK